MQRHQLNFHDNFPSSERILITLEMATNYTQPYVKYFVCQMSNYLSPFHKNTQLSLKNIKQ